jgi:hypothetical protein
MAISLAILADHGCRVALAPALDFRPTQRAADLCGRAGDCCREDCPFHSTPRRPWFWSLLLSSAPVARLGRQSGLSGPARAPDLPPLTRGTLLCAARTFLYPRKGSDHPTHTGASSPHTRPHIIRKASLSVKAICRLTMAFGTSSGGWRSDAHRRGGPACPPWLGAPMLDVATAMAD